MSIVQKLDTREICKTADDAGLGGMVHISGATFLMDRIPTIPKKHPPTA